MKRLMIVLLVIAMAMSLGACESPVFGDADSDKEETRTEQQDAPDTAGEAETAGGGFEQASLTDEQISQIESVVPNMLCLTAFSHIGEVEPYRLLLFAAYYSGIAGADNEFNFVGNVSESGEGDMYFHVSQQALTAFLQQVFGPDVPSDLRTGADQYARIYGDDLVRFMDGEYVFFMGDGDPAAWYEYHSQRCVGKNDIEVVFDYYCYDVEAETEEPYQSTMTLHVSPSDNLNGWMITSQEFSNPEYNNWMDESDGTGGSRYYEGQVVVDIAAESAKGDNHTPYDGYILATLPVMYGSVRRTRRFDAAISWGSISSLA